LGWIAHFFCGGRFADRAAPDQTVYPQLQAALNTVRCAHSPRCACDQADEKVLSAAGRQYEETKRWEEMKIGTMSDGRDDEMKVDYAGNEMALRFEAPDGCAKRSKK
jgi:hypothetical protein